MQKKMILIGLALLISFSQMSCRHAVTGQELMAYMVDGSHGLYQQKQAGSGEVTVQLLPSAYLVLQDMQTGAAYTQAQADSTEKAYAQFYYFRVMIRGIGKPAAQAAYFNFGIREELGLIKGRDTLPCGICQHIANGNKEVEEYLVAFPVNGGAHGERQSGPVELYYSGKALGLESLSFPFSRATFRKIPVLKI